VTLPAVGKTSAGGGGHVGVHVVRVAGHRSREVGEGEKEGEEMQGTG